MRATLMIAVVLLCTGSTLIACADEADSPIQSHAETQELFAKWVATGDRLQAEEHYSLLARLRPLSMGDPGRFVEQILYFIDHMEQREKAKASVVRSLLFFCMVPHGELAAAVSPYLYGEHAALRKEAWNLFPAVLGSGLPEASADLSHIRQRVTGNRQEEKIATPLKRAIFEVAPNEAFRLFLGEAERLDGIRLTRAHRTLSNALFERNLVVHERGHLQSAKKPGGPEGRLPLPPEWKLDEKSTAALGELANNEHWWARMFASEFMVHNKDFRVEELIEKLEQDENDLVRQSAISITTPNPLRAPVGPMSCLAIFGQSSC